MNYRITIENALSTLNVPVSFMNYRGTATTYVTYFCYTEKAEDYAENAPISTAYYVQIDIWSKSSDYELLVNQIESAMTAANFKDFTSEDLFESDTKIYHKAIRMNCKVERI